jgi:hypothetical protein
MTTTTYRLTPDQRSALLPAWALYEVRSHVPSDIDGGPTCDERGCMICNGGDEAVAMIVEAIEEGIDQGPDVPRYTLPHPDDEEIMDALRELASGEFFDEMETAPPAWPEGTDDDSPEVWHTADTGMNHGRTHTLCGMEITWGFDNMTPKRPDEHCQVCTERDG